MTQRVPVKEPQIETLTANDREEVHRIVTDLRQTYLDRHTEALIAFHKAEREVNRKQHEVHRIEKHLERIEAFCKENNIPVSIAMREGNKE